LNRCWFCFQKLKPNDPTVELKIGLVHEKCYLEKRLSYYREEIKRISNLPKLEQNFKERYGVFIRLAKSMKQEPFDHSRTQELYDRWLEANRSMMDIGFLWSFAKFYHAQRSWKERLAAWLLERPFAYSKTPSMIRKWNKNWQELLTVFTDYFNLNIEPLFLEEIRTLSGLKTKEECQRRIDTLTLETREITKDIISEARRDLWNYSSDLQEEYREWRNENGSKLFKYNLFP